MVQLVLSLALFVGSVSAGQEQRPLRQLPAPTDIDPQLTEELRRVEQNLSNAILLRDANALERLAGPEFTVRVADVSQGSMPRAIWEANTLTVSGPNRSTFEIARPASSPMIWLWSA
jgi:hypothetical protein